MIINPYSFGTTLVNQYSFLFDGVNERINFGDVFDFGTGDFSISFWAKLSAGGYVYRKQLDSANAGFQFYFGGANGRPTFIIRDTLGNTSGTTELNTTDYRDSTWRNFVLAYQRSSNVRLYIDGTLNSSSIISTISASLDNSQNFYISYTAFPYNGYIDEFAVWNTNLDATGAAATISGSKPANLATHPNVANLVGWFRADGDSNPNVADNSGNGNTGTMENMESGDIQTDVP